MNLYRIERQHLTPKGELTGLFTFLVANTDEEVYGWLDGFACWSDQLEIDEAEENINAYVNSDTGRDEDWKERMIRLKGDMNDDDLEWEDLYYGVTLYGWSLVIKDVEDSVLKTLRGLNIVESVWD